MPPSRKGLWRLHSSRRSVRVLAVRRASCNYPHSLFCRLESRDWPATWVDWTRASMGAQRAKIRPRSSGNGRRETTIAPEERRSTIVGRHSRRPFTVHCLAFVPPIAIPCTSQHAFAESLLLSADSLLLSS